jgi:hypothetical protein
MVPSFSLGVLTLRTARSERGEENTERGLSYLPRIQIFMSASSVISRYQRCQCKNRASNRRLLIRQTPSAFHPHAQRNAFRRRDVRLQSRLFARGNQSLRCNSHHGNSSGSASSSSSRSLQPTQRPAMTCGTRCGAALCHCASRRATSLRQIVSGNSLNKREMPLASTNGPSTRYVIRSQAITWRTSRTLPRPRWNLDTTTAASRLLTTASLLDRKRLSGTGISNQRQCRRSFHWWGDEKEAQLPLYQFIGAGLQPIKVSSKTSRSTVESDSGHMSLLPIFKVQ